jgi:dihydrofolate reductase
MTISLIAAVAENRAIGKDNKMLWHLPEDLKYFKNHTVGHSLIMGRKTFESFPVRPLPNRRNIIITRQSDYPCETCIIVKSPEEALAQCKDDEEVFIGGGAGIYKQFLDKADKMYLTHIHESFEADTFFPKFEAENWEIIKKSERKTDHRNNLSYTFVEYKKKTRKP